MKNNLAYTENYHTMIIFLEYKKPERSLFFMDYELMMNGNVKIGQKAPDFEVTTTLGPRTLNDYKGKWLVFFSHPGDFTLVCSDFKLFEICF